MIVAGISFYVAIVACIAIISLGVGIGQGLVSKKAVEAQAIQPNARIEITRATTLALALLETIAIIGGLASLMMLAGYATSVSSLAQSAYLGIGLSMSIIGLLLSICSGIVASNFCSSIARQPFSTDAIIRFMLVTLSFMQTPLLFAFIVSIIIKTQIVHSTTTYDMCRLLASAICITLGSIGPILGMAKLVSVASLAAGRITTGYKELFSFTLLSQTIIETPLLFAAVTAISFLFMIPKNLASSGNGAIAIAASLCMGLGTLGAGLASGHTASTACEAIIEHPLQYPSMSKMSILIQTFIETTTLYAFLLTILLLFTIH